MDTTYSITKCENVFINKPEDVTDHFRDPQIFDYKGQFYAIEDKVLKKLKELSSFIKLSVTVLKGGQK